jgi:PAS domain-containing protein
VAYVNLLKGNRRKLKAFLEEKRLKAILGSVPDAIMICDSDANIVDCSDAALKLSLLSSFHCNGTR